MEEVKNDIIKKYKYKDYVVYIKETKDAYASYLQNEKYGVVNLMFGVTKESCTFKGFKKLIESDIEYFIDTYKDSIED